MNSGAFILGPAVAQFESNFAQQMGCKHAIGVNSGTDALLMTLHSLGIQPEDQIICPAFTFVATADVIARLGAYPVFVDVGPDYTIDVEHVAELINEKTKAILAVHLYGKMADVKRLAEICAERGIHLIEDVAQATGAMLEGKAAGTFGIAGCFSFYPTKNLGGFGDGGMVITDNDELAERLRIFRDHGKSSDGAFLEIGYNSRLSSIQAALLDVKLPNLEEDNADRIANATFYYSAINASVYGLPIQGPEGDHVYNLFTIRHPKRNELKAFLAERKIGSAIYYSRPLHLEPCFSYMGYQEGHFPVAEQFAREVLSIPVAPGLTRQELEEVTTALDQFALSHK